eukprot:CAMPEP_0201714668 /NCGR_PEP_ID=MMETSP0593-20130828/1048_1 /ASSEMBLY_ACC=CAM_ASM_000672 /TAXON_ID=267983 /ORGANISM="Skeletonema japonicum, Strain CCMP2506" /LENGTH=245 /DNA_ID=CAMNT_0048203963 /DNA_START=109 /DNA_END=846 /DNA_ORIENTATION=+
MIIRLAYLTSAFSLAAASKSSKIAAPTPSTDTASTSKSNKIAAPTASTSKSSKSPTAKSSSGPTLTDTSKAGKSIGSKSSKTDGYFVAPFSCPQSCITGQNYELSTDTLEDAVTVCDATNEYQMWKVHVDGTFLKFESAAHYDEGMCLAVKETCSGGLSLADCSDPESEWIGTGGQLLSALCWSQGTSAALSVDGGCNDLIVDSSSETFLLLESDFIESIIVPTAAPIAATTTTATTTAVTTTTP